MKKTLIALFIGLSVGLYAQNPIQGIIAKQITDSTTSRYVPATRTVNGHPLSSNVTVTASDVSAVSTSTTVNGHALSGNISVTSTDVAQTIVKFVAPISESGFARYGGTNDAITANVVLAAKFYLPYTIVVNTIGACVTTLYSTSTINVGIYNAAGTTKLIDGNMSSTTTGYKTAAVSPAVTLTPGYYWCAYSNSNSTVRVAGHAEIAQAGIDFDNTVYGTAANPTSGGVLPATLGTITTTYNNGALVVLHN